MSSAYVSDNRVAAVIIGGELNGLGVVRSIARQRLPIVAVDIHSSRAALWSRHARSRVIRSFTGPEFVEDMIELGKQFDHPPVLILTAEEAVPSVSENRDVLSKWFRFRIPVDETVKCLSSKARFHTFSLLHGFPVPRTAIIENRSDLGLLGQLRYPCVLKPDDKRDVLSGRKERAVRVGSLGEALDRASEMLITPGGIIAQEWVEGPESSIYFTLFYRGADGHVAGIFTGRKLSCYPRDVGSTATCVAAPEARDILEPMTLAFAEQAGMDGMGSMEYKWDDLHKRFVMIEPTVGRTDWQGEIATLCGVNIPLAAYRHELGLPPLSEPFNRTPWVWRATIVDTPPLELVTPGAKTLDGYFRWGDPLPALKFYCLDHPLQRIMRRWNKRNQAIASQDSVEGRQECHRPTP
jgi:D-aspartate ligase